MFVCLSCSLRNGRLRFCHTSLLHFPQSGIDLREFLHGRIQIGELYLAHVRQHSQLVEVVADGFLLPQDFFETIHDDDALAKAAGGHIVTHGHARLLCQCPDFFAVCGRHAGAEFDAFFHVFSYR